MSNGAGAMTSSTQSGASQSPMDHLLFRNVLPYYYLFFPTPKHVFSSQWTSNCLKEENILIQAHAQILYRYIFIDPRSNQMRKRARQRLEEKLTELAKIVSVQYVKSPTDVVKASGDRNSTAGQPAIPSQTSTAQSHLAPSTAQHRQRKHRAKRTLKWGISPYLPHLALSTLMIFHLSIIRLPTSISSLNISTNDGRVDKPWILSKVYPSTTLSGELPSTTFVQSILQTVLPYLRSNLGKTARGRPSPVTSSIEVADVQKQCATETDQQHAFQEDMNTVDALDVADAGDAVDQLPQHSSPFTAVSTTDNEKGADPVRLGRQQRIHHQYDVPMANRILYSIIDEHKVPLPFLENQFRKKQQLASQTRKASSTTGLTDLLSSTSITTTTTTMSSNQDQHEGDGTSTSSSTRDTTAVDKVKQLKSLVTTMAGLLQLQPRAGGPSGGTTGVEAEIKGVQSTSISASKTSPTVGDATNGPAMTGTDGAILPPDHLQPREMSQHKMDDEHDPSRSSTTSLALTIPSKYGTRVKEVNVDQIIENATITQTADDTHPGRLASTPTASSSLSPPAIKPSHLSQAVRSAQVQPKPRMECDNSYQIHGSVVNRLRSMIYYQLRHQDVESDDGVIKQHRRSLLHPITLMVNHHHQHKSQCRRESPMIWTEPYTPPEKLNDVAMMFYNCMTRPSTVFYDSSSGGVGGSSAIASTTRPQGPLKRRGCDADIPSFDDSSTRLKKSLSSSSSSSTAPLPHLQISRQARNPSCDTDDSLDDADDNEDCRRNQTDSDCMTDLDANASNTSLVLHQDDLHVISRSLDAFQSTSQFLPSGCIADELGLVDDPTLSEMITNYVKQTMTGAATAADTTVKPAHSPSSSASTSQPPTTTPTTTTTTQKDEDWDGLHYPLTYIQSNRTSLSTYQTSITQTTPSSLFVTCSAERQEVWGSVLLALSLLNVRIITEQIRSGAITHQSLASSNPKSASTASIPGGSDQSLMFGFTPMVNASCANTIMVESRILQQFLKANQPHHHGNRQQTQQRHRSQSGERRGSATLNPESGNSTRAPGGTAVLHAPIHTIPEVVNISTMPSFYDRDIYHYLIHRWQVPTNTLYLPSQSDVEELLRLQNQHEQSHVLHHEHATPPVPVLHDGSAINMTTPINTTPHAQAARSLVPPTNESSYAYQLYYHTLNHQIYYPFSSSPTSPLHLYHFNFDADLSPYTFVPKFLNGLLSPRSKRASLTSYIQSVYSTEFSTIVKEQQGKQKTPVLTNGIDVQPSEGQQQPPPQQQSSLPQQYVGTIIDNTKASDENTMIDLDAPTPSLQHTFHNDQQLQSSGQPDTTATASQGLTFQQFGETPKPVPKSFPHGDLSFNVLWTWRHSTIDHSKLLAFQRVNHFQRSYHLTRKDALYKCISRYARFARQYDRKKVVLPIHLITSNGGGGATTASSADDHAPQPPSSPAAAVTTTTAATPASPLTAPHNSLEKSLEIMPKSYVLPIDTRLMLKEYQDRQENCAICQGTGAVSVSAATSNADIRSTTITPPTTASVQDGYDDSQHQMDDSQCQSDDDNHNSNQQPCECQLWIVKPANSSRGRGIFITSDISTVIEPYQAALTQAKPTPGGHANSNPPDAQSDIKTITTSSTNPITPTAGEAISTVDSAATHTKPQEADVATEPLQQIVVQHYIKRPLLLHGRKFDLRIYVLVTSFEPLEAFVYNEGYARYAGRAYSDDINDIHGHLTNSSLNFDYVKTHPTSDDVAVPFGSEGSPTPSSHVPSTPSGSSRDHLSSTIDDDQVDPNDPNSNSADSTPLFLRTPTGGQATFDNCKQLFSEWLLDLEKYHHVNPYDILRSIDAIILKSLLSVSSRIGYQPCSFELFGYDIMFDAELRPWLLEVNSSPSMNLNSDIDSLVKPQMIADTLSLISPLPFDRAHLASLLKQTTHLLEYDDLDVQYTKSPNNSNDNIDEQTNHKTSPAHHIQQLALNNIYSTLLSDFRPRVYGELPVNIGNYRRLAPNGPGSVWTLNQTLYAFMKKIKLK